ncbi:MAG: PINc/VapC family ATPase [Nanoarchaeota archaeon]|nr:PINc/VapC family ATPase [Nanoarchaeota archaeon]
MEKLVPDTSVIIEGLISSKIKNKELVAEHIIFHEAVLAELEHQANQEKAIGHLGLDEITEIKKLSKKMGFKVEFLGKRPTQLEIKHASLGEIDSLIRELAWEKDATLITADKVQAKVAQAKGAKYKLIAPQEEAKKLQLDAFFDPTTMSVHLRENVPPAAKKGTPGNWKFIPLRKAALTQDEIREISKEIIEHTKMRKDGFIEIQREGSTIIQLGTYRIVVTKPPFSDGWEITAVKPVKQLKIEDYNLTEKLRERIAEQAEGILIAGAPGNGKTTFAAAMARYYASKDKIVKTIEAPRDLILPDKITQYAISHGDAQEIHDILLLSRPDYTVFDEMRNTDDFKLFADLRLSGIGLLGVIHATNPIDAIQRFVGRIELGVIPQVIDTVIFIKNGEIDEVLSLKMTVKVPSGMTEADLARPVTEVKNFETGELKFEIYSYGEETVVVPVTAQQKSPIRSLAEKQIEKILSRLTEKSRVEILSEHKAVIYVPASDKARIIGKEGRTIEAIEQKVGLRIDVHELIEGVKGEQKKAEYELHEDKNNVRFYIKESGANVDFIVDKQFLFTATASKKGEVKVHKKSKLGKALSEAIQQNRLIELHITE